MSEIRTVWKRDITELSEIQTSSDFRHSLYSECPKSKCAEIRTGFCSDFGTTVNVRNPNMFGFQTGPFCSVLIIVRLYITPKSEQICSDFRHKYLFEYRTEYNRTSEQTKPPECLKSKRLKSEQNLFGFPNRMFGFRTSTVIDTNITR